jgi:type I restriction enzyme, R subunit
MASLDLLLSPAEKAVQDEVVEIAERIGWTQKTPEELAPLREGRMGEVIVEPLLIDAIEKINDVSRTEAEAVASEVRRFTSDRQFLKALNEGVNLKLDPEKPAKDYYLVGFAEFDNNTFIVTTEFVLKTGGVREPRLDVVFLVNGLPLGMIENKAPDHELTEAAKDWGVYYSDAPQLKSFGCVIGINNGIRFRVGPTGLAAVQDYAEWKDTWPNPMPGDGEDEMEVALVGAYSPATLIDLAVNFIVFETREGDTTKKLARYQQFRAANKIVERALGGGDRGLIWHTTGSGKSLTMVFAARKLMGAGLDRPTVFIVIDRVDLDDQISGTFGACEFDGVANVTTGDKLRQLIDADKRGVVVTIVNKFRSVGEAVADRDNVIVFVDEAHRSQEGEFGIWMRTALPKARIFGFTGTPVETDDRSTRRAFSPVLEEKDGFEVYENYLDAYSIAQSIEDGATVPVVYEPRLDEWKIEDRDLDKLFEKAFGHLPEEQRERLRRDAARDAVIAKAPTRTEAITADVVELMKERVWQNGFKAQLVAVDREACVAYAAELAKHLNHDEFAVVMSRDVKKDSPELREWWPKAAWARVNGAEVESEEGDEATTPEAELGHRKATRELIERFKKPDSPLKVLVVNAMLLTGFDAPIEQAMFLDRGLKKHTLLQAIARTNRTMPGKEAGVVFDYWGVFDDLDAALREFTPEDVAQAAVSTGTLAERFPEAIEEAMETIAGMPDGLSDRKRMLWLVRHFGDNPELAARFEEAFSSAKGIYETLAPDPRLKDHLAAYRALLKLRAIWKHGAREDPYDITPHQAKTHKMVQDAISEIELRDDLPVFRIDGNYLERLDGLGLSGEEKATDIEAAVVHEIKVRGEHDPVARSLAERLRLLQEKREAEHQVTMELLEAYEELVREHAAEEEATKAAGLSKRARAIAVLAKAHASEVPEEIHNKLGIRLDERLAEITDFPGWQERQNVLQEIERTIISELAAEADTRSLLTGSYVQEAVAAIVAEAE